MKKIAILSAVAGYALTLGACTPEQQQAAVAGVTAACTAAAVGTTIYVQVEASNGTTAQDISKQVQGDVAQDCPILTAAVTGAISGITNSGATATVTVATSAPKSAKQTVRAKVKVRRDSNGQMQMTYVIKPDIVLPFVGAL